MTDDEDRTRVVSPNTLPLNGAAKRATTAQETLDTAALAREPLDFDLSGGDDASAAGAGTLDFDLTGGHELAAASSAMPLDLDLGAGETSIAEVASPAAAAPAAPVSPPAAAPVAPAPSGGIGKWIAIALAIAAAILATVFLRK